jgi:hypothetical protein
METEAIRREERKAGSEETGKIPTSKIRKIKTKDARRVDA